MEVRSPVTARPVLPGLVPGLTVTVNNVEPPGDTDEGLAAPVPEGLVAPPARVKVPVPEKKVSLTLVAPLAELPYVPADA